MWKQNNVAKATKSSLFELLSSPFLYRKRRERKILFCWHFHKHWACYMEKWQRWVSLAEAEFLYGANMCTAAVHDGFFAGKVPTGSTTGTDPVFVLKSWKLHIRLKHSLQLLLSLSSSIIFFIICFNFSKI